MIVTKWSKNPVLHPLTVFWGETKVLKEYARNILLKLPDTEISRLAPVWKDIKTEASEYSLLTDKKVILIEDGDQLLKDYISEVTAVSTLPLECPLCIFVSKIDERTKLYKTLPDKCYIWTDPEEGVRDLSALLDELTGKHFHLLAIKLLLAISGDSFSIAAQEGVKAATYCSRDTILEKDVAEVCVDYSGATVWNMLDFIYTDMAKAIECLDECLLRDHAVQIYGAIHLQYSRLVLIASLEESLGYDVAYAQSKAPPYFKDKIKYQLRNVNRAKLPEMMIKLKETELALKGESGNKDYRGILLNLLLYIKSVRS